MEQALLAEGPVERMHGESFVSGIPPNNVPEEMGVYVAMEAEQSPKGSRRWRLVTGTAVAGVAVVACIVLAVIFASGDSSTASAANPISNVPRTPAAPGPVSQTSDFAVQNQAAQDRYKSRLTLNSGMDDDLADKLASVHYAIGPLHGGAGESHQGRRLFGSGTDSPTYSPTPAPTPW